MDLQDRHAPIEADGVDELQQAISIGGRDRDVRILGHDFFPGR
jgi:hypothetical protein